MNIKNNKYIKEAEVLNTCHKLIGKKISLIWQSIQPATFLEVGKLRKVKNYSLKKNALYDRLQGEFNICIYTNWQLIKEKKIILSSKKQTKNNVPVLEKYLKENKIKKIFLKHRFIEIYFDKEVSLRIFRRKSQMSFMNIGKFNTKYLVFDLNKYYFAE